MIVLKYDLFIFKHQMQINISSCDTGDRKPIVYDSDLPLQVHRLTKQKYSSVISN